MTQISPFAKETCRRINFDTSLAIEVFEQFSWYRIVEKARKGHDIFKVVVFFSRTVFDISKNTQFYKIPTNEAFFFFAMFNFLKSHIILMINIKMVLFFKRIAYN